MNADNPLFHGEGVDIDAVHRRVRAGTAPDTQPLHWSLPVQALLRGAHKQGHAQGERTGYIAGARAGCVTWLCWGFLAGAATVAVCLQFGLGRPG